MRIVVDINHPAHVHYFKNFIWEMEKRGHEILITASEKDISYRLLDAYGFSYVKLGNYGNSILKKIVNLPLLDFRMYKAVKRFNPDLFLGFGSIRAAHVSRILKKPCIALDDTEHAVWEHRLYVPFTDVIITPMCFRKDFGKKNIRYQGYTELAYLHPDYFIPDFKILKEIGINEDDPIIVIRFVSWQAGHDLGQVGIRNRTFYVKELQKYGRVLISSESPLEKENESLRIKFPPEQLHNLLYYATLYIGEGATTASECAMLGTHALYVNTLECGVQQDLEQKYGLVYNFSKKETMEIASLEKAKELLKKPSFQQDGKRKRDRLIEENISLTRYLVWFIEHYRSHYQIRIMNEDRDNRGNRGSCMQKQICSRCICDTTIPSIIFDQNGVCNFCHEYDERDRNYPLSPAGAHRLESIINTIKKQGQRRTYDCVIGVSGGTDSTYCLYLAKEWGLRPLAVHFDNGWDSKIAFENIKKATDALDIDLYTHVAEWEEFKDLQLAFLKASVPDADIPTDVAIHAVLYRTCQTEGIRYIINGSNFRTEGNQPPSWGYGDGKYVMSVYQKFGKYQKLSKIPVDTLYDLFNFHIIQGLRVIKPLYFIDYQKEQAKSLLTNELGWQYYGGHHYENTYTRFIHGYYLPKKFGIDKRIIEYSALIRSNQMTREEALQKLVQPCYLPDQIEDDIRFVLNKLGMSRNDFEEIMNQPNKCFTDYITYYPIIIKLRFFLSMAQKLGLYPDKIYGRYSY